MQTKQIIAKNKKTGNKRTYACARTASKALNGKGTPGSEKTITKRCQEGGGLFRNTWVSYKK